MSVEITTVEAKSIPFELKPDPRQKGMAKQIELPAELLAQIEADRRKATEIGAVEKFEMAWGIAMKLLPLLFKIVWSFYMGNWKTTITAVVTAIVAILAHFGLDVSLEVQGIILSIGLALVGIFAKDAKVTPENQTDKTLR